MTGGGAPGRRWPWLLPAALYAALIFWLSSQSNPLPMLPRTWLSQDKLLHALEYAGLAAAVAWGLRRLGAARSSAGLLAVALGSLYGLTDEIHQAFVPGRSADVRDWVADTAGAALGALVVVVVSLRRRRSAG